MSVDDSTILVRVVARERIDDRAFVELVGREHRGVVAAVALIVGDVAIAEDIAQESLERAYARWDRVGRLERPGAWVRRVAINRAISVIRKRASERRALDRMRTARDVSTETLMSMWTHGVGFDGSAARLWSAVKDLPQAQATAVALHYGADLSLETVAVEMDTTVSSVKSLLHRARTTLRNHETVKEFEDERP